MIIRCHEAENHEVITGGATQPSNNAHSSGSSDPVVEVRPKKANNKKQTKKQKETQPIQELPPAINFEENGIMNKED
jgi:hypothetical protein